jgi:hypothetical protein
VQCLGSERSLGTLPAAVTTRADEGSDRYFSLRGVCTVLRSTVYGIPTFWPSVDFVAWAFRFKPAANCVA